MNLLFVCSRNKWRSATAETIYKDSQDFNVRSAGTEPSAKVRVNAKLINWADVIFVMEKRHKQRLTEKFEAEIEGKKMIVLDIPDEYKFMDEELVEEIKTKVEGYLR